jgi:hypothetical protein
MVGSGIWNFSERVFAMKRVPIMSMMAKSKRRILRLPKSKSSIILM